MKEMWKKSKKMKRFFHYISFILFLIAGIHKKRAIKSRWEAGP